MVLEIRRSANEKWEPVSVIVPPVYPDPASRAGGRRGDPPPSGEPLPGAGRIFAQVSHLRDSERCGRTLFSLFSKAAQPELLTVGLMEQNDKDDKTCVEHFGELCVEDQDDGVYHCPYMEQIRLVSLFATAGHGSIYARSLLRKVLGDEEFCLQLDSHSDVIPGWDDVLLTQWTTVGNENAILSADPPPAGDLLDANATRAPAPPVALACDLEWTAEGLPANGLARSEVRGAARPWPANGWSPRFSFHKCHAEMAAPYDPFLRGTQAPEGFGRYARWFTRGYDVYVPSEHAVSHMYFGNPQKYRYTVLHREEAIRRVKTMLQIYPGGDAGEDAQANMGIYGLGRRRTLDQLIDYTGFDVRRQMIVTDKCAARSWVPYDPKISPLEPMYGRPSDPDPEPEYWRREELGLNLPWSSTRPAEPWEGKGGGDSLRNYFPMRGLPLPRRAGATVGMRTQDLRDNLVLVEILVGMWVLGLVVWMVLVVNGRTRGVRARGQMRRQRAVKSEEKEDLISSKNSGKNA